MTDISDEIRKVADEYDVYDVLPLYELADRIDAEHEKAEQDLIDANNQMERLVTLLRVDCDIDASWDGLRRFWIIGLTEDGCLMRDRACKAEAENAKLRELAKHLRECTRHNTCAVCEYADDACDFDYDMRELGVEGL